jgi:hypothetical protein
MLIASLSNANNFEFGIEKFKARLRFIIYFKEEEIACRKEDIKVLTSFFRSTGIGIFQGRIKLRSELDHIVVYFKGECLGSIAKNELETALKEIFID